MGVAKIRIALILALILVFLVQGVIFLRSVREASAETSKRATGAAGKHRQAPKDLRLHGVHPLHKKGSHGPRIAILTLQILSHYKGPSNVKEYASKWNYDYIEASRSIHSAITALKRYGGDPLFLKVFAILRFLPQYDWVFWHDSDAIFLNHSRRLEEYVDDHYDMIFTAGPCGSGRWAKVLNTGHMLIKNAPSSMTTFRSVWGLWNHTHCKYGEGKGNEEGEDGPPLCHLSNNRPVYHNGDQGALMSVLSHCDACEAKVKYTGFRTFNSLYPCHGQGDLVIHMPGTDNPRRKEVFSAFLQQADTMTGTFEENDILAGECASPDDHDCSTRQECDKRYHGLNRHRRCPR